MICRCFHAGGEGWVPFRRRRRGSPPIRLMRRREPAARGGQDTNDAPASGSSGSEHGSQQVGELTMVAELLSSVAFSVTKSASPVASQPPGVEA